MPRKPRRLPPGGTFHVFNRGVRQQDIFRDDADREFFVATLAAVAKQLGWRILAVCLMGNHYHLVVETPNDNLVQGMHLLKTRFTIRFNRVHGTSGHVFEKRFRSEPVETQEYLEYLLGYVASNPVKDGFSDRAEDWRWSTYGAVIRGEPSVVDAERLFERIALNGRDPREVYRACLKMAAKGAWPLSEGG